jgi:hypothetical protein
MPKSYGLDRAGPLMGHVSHSDSCWPASPLSHPFRTWAYSFHVITLTCHYVYYGSEEREPCHPHLTGAAAAIPPDRCLPRLRRPTKPRRSSGIQPDLPASIAAEALDSFSGDAARPVAVTVAAASAAAVAIPAVPREEGAQGPEPQPRPQQVPLSPFI